MVTGASGGIGRATVGRLASAGHVVFAAHRTLSALHDLAEELPRMHPVILDVTEPSSIDRAFDKVQAETGGYGLDVLVNVAGIMILGRFASAISPIWLETTEGGHVDKAHEP
jgi:NAD(P)-dependent dehydrogenase (short-subunit alcohol dehydrogenase family)